MSAPKDVAVRATHVISMDDARVWLKEHGLDISEVVEATIHLDNRGSVANDICAWVDVVFYKTNERGDRYLVTNYESGKDPATGRASIPLHRFPDLREAERA
jgi:hypothetical protein